MCARHMQATQELHKFQKVITTFGRSTASPTALDACPPAFEMPTLLSSLAFSAVINQMINSRRIHRIQ